ncbi:hypothetical protein [Calothrix sp. PCC 6303]|uniref:hypothetical protein n=1 Tax=Calothrix sp. PCC 6303 TaxID=1170562 RepID=UPI0002A0259A|nr:hypothetical protein [Calothrix sp. PCC 6303]AFZ02568.1 hypothetical protein Cal6303_3643 [Calothrix sp. PCC 6303]
MNDFFHKIHVKLLYYLIDNWEDLSANPRWFIMRKFARFHFIRAWKNAYLKEADESILSPNSNSIFTDIDIPQVVELLEEYGLFQGLKLPQTIVKEILDFSLSTNCYAGRKPSMGFHVWEREKAQLYYQTKILSAKYFNTASQCPAIKMLEQDPTLLKIAARYLKTTPLHIGNSLFWSFPTDSDIYEQSKSAQVFHCDLDDYKFLKFFFYLTDVDLGCGPHVYILKSHKKKNFSSQILRGRATEKDLIDYYGIENVVHICGSAGWGFAEDSFGNHKGSPPITKPRLILQVEFATYDYGMQQDIIDPIHLKSISFSPVVSLKSYSAKTK